MTINKKQFLITILHALAVWAVCGAIIGIGRGLAPLQTVLIIHAIVAPAFAALVALFYFKKFNYYSPLKTAFIFLLFVFIMDAGLIAPVFEKNFAMFGSILGTWLPMVLIFLAVYLTGLVITNKKGV